MIHRRRRAWLLLAPLLLAACGAQRGVPSPEQVRAQCEAERTRRGIGRLLPPETRVRPECRFLYQTPPN